MVTRYVPSTKKPQNERASEYCPIVPALSNQLPEHPSNLSSSDPVGPKSRLLKRGQFVSQKYNFRHALAIQSKKIRDALQRQRKFEEEFEQELERESMQMESRKRKQ